MARVLVLGGYGLIGAHVARALAARGHAVVPLGRDKAAARRVLPGYPWVFHDLRDLLTPDAWKPLIAGVDVVVNCAGALQDNARDDLVAVHLRAIGALVLACERAGAGLVQISAVGAEPDAKMAFFRTKAEGDALIRESSAAWWIFRPGLVYAPTAFGGTALIRVLASVPVVQPIALPHVRAQTVWVDDVARAVWRAVEGETPPRLEADLVEAESHSFADIVAATRRWLGFPAARLTVAAPAWLVHLAARGADALGWLGWRSPLRTTAIRAMELGVSGRAHETPAALGRPALPFDETLRAMPARVEDRMFARAQLLAPLLLLALAVSWVMKGVSGLVGFEEVTAERVARGVGDLTGRVVVATLSAVAVALGLSLLVRRWAVRTLVVMVFVTLFHAAAITLIAPDLWGDPLGAGANVIVVMVALLAARVMLDTR